MSANVRIDRLTKLYDNNVVGVEDVTLQLGMGIHGLLGPNGASKALIPLADAMTPAQAQCRRTDVEARRQHAPHLRGAQSGGTPMRKQVLSAVLASLALCAATGALPADAVPSERQRIAWAKHGALRAAPELKESDYKVVGRPRVTVRYARFQRKYAEAFASILAEALTAYERMGFNMPAKVTLEASVDPRQTALWTDGVSALFLRLRSKDLLRPATQTGVFNIHGMCHELGHVSMYAGLSSMMGLPAGVGEGWAHYIGSVVVSDVARKLGKSIWPEPYDVGRVEGLGRLKRQADQQPTEGWDSMDPTSRAALTFYKMEQDYGRDKTTRAMIQALAQRPMGKDLMPLMVKRLRELTGNPRAADWVAESVLVPRVEWNVKDRSTGDTLFADQKVSKDASGLELSYDDGKMDAKLSTAGAGHAVVFRAPEGSWKLDGIRLFGARYGEEQAPKEDFAIYVCDENFNVLHTIRLPYSEFECGDEKWVALTFDPVDVPRVFYVCVDFNPTATKGVYVGQDTSVVRSHSRLAMPYSFVSDLRTKVDWMIRAHLREAASPGPPAL